MPSKTFLTLCSMEHLIKSWEDVKAKIEPEKGDRQADPQIRKGVRNLPCKHNA